MIIMKIITRYLHLLKWRKPHTFSLLFKTIVYIVLQISFLVTYLQWLSHMTS